MWSGSATRAPRFVLTTHAAVQDGDGLGYEIQAAFADLFNLNELR